MAGHSRSKNGVLSHAYVPAIHVFDVLPRSKDVDARDKRGHGVMRRGKIKPNDSNFNCYNFT